MTAYQQERTLGTMYPTGWSTYTYDPGPWCFSPAGDEVWQVFLRNSSAQFRPRLARYSWPGLAEIDSFEFDWYQGGTGQAYDDPLSSNGYWTNEGGFIQAVDDDTLLAARVKLSNSGFGRDLLWDTWTFGDSTGTNIATLPYTASSDSNDGFAQRGLLWDVDAAKGLAFVADRNDNDHIVYEIDSGGLTLLDSGNLAFRWNGSENPGAVSTDGEIHFMYRVSGDGSFDYRLGIYDTATGTLTKATSATGGWELYAGLADGAGTIPFGNGVFYETYNATEALTAGYDLGSINSPGTGTRRTVDAIGNDSATRRWKTDKAHDIAGVHTYNSEAGSLTWYEAYLVGTPDSEGSDPVVGSIGIT